MEALSPASLSACAIAAALLLLPARSPGNGPRQSPPAVEVPILAYHRFGPAVQDAMTVRTATFRSQLDYLKEHNYPVVPLRSLVACLLGRGPALPPRAVVVTVDDGHASVFTDMWPLVRAYQIPVTLFIYPSAISRASYAMTWEQLAALQGTGLFEVQSHTYWHPNFKTERRRLSPDAFRAFVIMQFEKPRTVLEQKLGDDADLLAWPFGIDDDELIAMARDAGYVAGFTIERRRVTPREPIMALPRFLITDGIGAGRGFASILPQEQ